MSQIIKYCKYCGCDKPVLEFAFSKGKPRSHCKPCWSKNNTAKAKANPEKARKKHSSWRARTLNQQMLYPKPSVEMQKARHRAKQKAYNDANKDRVNAYKKKWADANKHVAMEVVRRRQASKKKATPIWANRFFMQEAYHLAKLRESMLGIPYDVDHIVPLQSEFVCGLHCEANLQVIPRTVNRQKHNRWWPDMW